MGLKGGHPMGWFFYLVGMVVVCAGTVRGQAPVLTTVSDTVYTATGAKASGVLLISWAGFTTAGGAAVPAGETSVAIGANGLLTIALVADVGAYPPAPYKVVYKLGDGSTHSEDWLVPATGPVTIGQVRVQIVPNGVAMQAATKQYVDQAVGQVQGDFLVKSGDTMTGPLVLSGDPVNGSQAANRHYVDTQVAGFTGALTQKLGRAGDTPSTLADVRYANQYAGATVGEQIDAACADLGGAQGTVVLPSSMGVGWSKAGVGDNCVIEDHRGQGGANGGIYTKNIDFAGRYTQTSAGLNLISPLMVEADAYAGGVNNYPQKTQWSALRLEMDGRTIGERKNIMGTLRCEGKGDCIGGAFWGYDWGGYGTGGDEGNEGGRFQSAQTDFITFTVPNGTVSGVNGNTVAVAWVNQSNAYAGEQRPLIDLSRGVYATGTVAAAGLNAGACTITGSGTQWTTLGTGAHGDLFLEITANDGPHLRWAVPVLSVVDDTHLTVEYNLGEIGATCLGATMAQSGAYKIYHGGVVTALGAVLPFTNKPGSLTLGAGGSAFQAGDVVEEPVGYNYHGAGVVALLGREVGEPQGSAYEAGNLGSAPFQNVLRAAGPFLYGVAMNGPLANDGLLFNSTVGGSLLRSNDKSAGQQAVLTLVNGGGALRQAVYDRTNDQLLLNTFPGVGVATLAVGTNPQYVAGNAAYVYYNNAAETGLTVAPAVVPGAGVAIVNAAVSGVPRFRVENLRTLVNNGSDLVGFSDNQSTQVWKIGGANGSAVFGSVLSNGNVNALGYQVNGAALGFANVAGTVGAGQLPTPTATTIGGVEAKDCSGTGHVQKINGDGTVTCAADGGGAVASVFGRTGAVTAASGDYAAAQVTNAVDKTAANSYAAGKKQTFSSSATTAGMNFAGVATDPTVLAAGDQWYNTAIKHKKVYDGAVAHVVMHQDDVTLAAQEPAHTGDMTNMQGSLATTVGAAHLASYTVASLPAAAGNSALNAIVTDGTTGGDCTAGGGAQLAFCRSNGTAWQAVGGGGGGTSSLLLMTVLPGGVSVAAGATTYGGISGGGNGVNTTEARVESFFPASCTLKGLYGSVGPNAVATATETFTVWKNGAATGLTCSVSGASGSPQSCSDAVHTVTVAAGDRLAMQVANTGSAATGNVVQGWGMVCQ